LLAAVSLYDLVSKPVALVLAAVIASIAVAVSLVWESEVVAGFGLIGAMIVPATLVFQGGLREIGTAFVAVVFAGATTVAVSRRWWILLQVAALVSAPQAQPPILRTRASSRLPPLSGSCISRPDWRSSSGSALRSLRRPHRS
jgi:hypothetical protein